jgi:hypothetical protein
MAPTNTASATAAPTQPPTATVTRTATASVFGARVYLPIVAGPIPTPTSTPTVTPYPTVIHNGGFDQGLAPWTTGGPLGASWVSNGGYPSGGGAALLGSPNFDSQCYNVPIGPGYIAQTMTVPNLPNPTLTFEYRIVTQDWTGSTSPPIYDWLGVYANQLDDAHHLVYLGNPTQGNSSCAAPLDMGWQRSVQLSLSQYQGQQITLYFAVFNGSDPYYNTYAYVDDIVITFSPGG